MNLHLAQVDSTLTARIDGNLTAETAEDLRTGAQAAIAQAKGSLKELVVDLSACAFIDSAGLGCLMGLKTHSGSRKIAFRVAGASPSVKRTFRSMRLDSVFGLLDD